MLAGLRARSAGYVPGISSLQVAFARLGLDLESVSVVHAHGKKFTGGAYAEVVQELKRGKQVFVLADSKFDISRLVKALTDGSEDCRIAVCSDLGYDNERISIGTPKDPPETTSSLYSLVVGKW